ncbi:hypothetical protein PO002_27890 [Cupriavidus necator]|uniref:hypothetical protein n=1 Tax=Cupriavidus necator TaxID=106590 RepID=UPI0039C40923
MGNVIAVRAGQDDCDRRAVGVRGDAWEKAGKRRADVLFNAKDQYVKRGFKL